MSKDHHQVTAGFVEAISRSIDDGNDAFAIGNLGATPTLNALRQRLRLPEGTKSAVLAAGSWGSSSGLRPSKVLIYLLDRVNEPWRYLVLADGDLVAATYSPAAAALVYNSMPYRDGMEIFR